MFAAEPMAVGVTGLGTLKKAFLNIPKESVRTMKANRTI